MNPKSEYKITKYSFNPAIIIPTLHEKTMNKRFNVTALMHRDIFKFLLICLVYGHKTRVLKLNLSKVIYFF